MNDSKVRMSPGEAVARALYESRGLGAPCSSHCVDHFQHDESAEASACRADGLTAHSALQAAGYSLMRPIENEVDW